MMLPPSKRPYSGKLRLAILFPRCSSCLCDQTPGVNFNSTHLSVHHHRHHYHHLTSSPPTALFLGTPRRRSPCSLNPVWLAVCARRAGRDRLRAQLAYASQRQALQERTQLARQEARPRTRRARQTCHQAALQHPAERAAQWCLVPARVDHRCCNARLARRLDRTSGFAPCWQKPCCARSRRASPRQDCF